ncbi:MAG: hypothetical protein ACOY31_10935 [Bacillota bacterium]
MEVFCLKDGGNKKVITRMRPDPDFEYLAGRARVLMQDAEDLSRSVGTDPGEIPGFYADSQVGDSP